MYNKKRPSSLRRLLERLLEYYASNDIVYGDVAARNILINKKTGKAKFCDMDNIQLASYPIEAFTEELARYCDIRGLDQEADAYMHNLMLLSKLGLELHDCIIDETEFLEEFSQKALSIFHVLQEPELFNGEYAIQYAKRR